MLKSYNNVNLINYCIFDILYNDNILCAFKHLSANALYTEFHLLEIIFIS